MMKSNSKLILGTIIAILILACSTIVFAADPIIIGGGNTIENEISNETANETTNETANEENTQNIGVINTETAGPNTQGNEANGNLPETGAVDVYIVAMLVTVCAISAIYAYRKVRDYNI